MISFFSTRKKELVEVSVVFIFNDIFGEASFAFWFVSLGLKLFVVISFKKKS